MPNTPASMKRSHFALFQKIYPFFLLVSSPSGLLTGLAWWIQQPVFSQPPSVRIYYLFTNRLSPLRAIVPANRVLQGVTAFPWTCLWTPYVSKLNIQVQTIKKKVNFVLRNFQVRLRREIRAKCSYRKGNLSIDDGFLLWKCIWDLNLLAKEMNAWLVTSRVA